MRVELAVHCPECWASGGEPCTDDRGDAVPPHPERQDQFEELVKEGEQAYRDAASGPDAIPVAA